MLRDDTATGTGTESCVVGSTYEIWNDSFWSLQYRSSGSLRYIAENPRDAPYYWANYHQCRTWSVGVAGHSGDVNEMNQRWRHRSFTARDGQWWRCQAMGTLKRSDVVTDRIAVAHAQQSVVKTNSEQEGENNGNRKSFDTIRISPPCRIHSTLLHWDYNVCVSELILQSGRSCYRLLIMSMNLIIIVPTHLVLCRPNCEPPVSQTTPSITLYCLQNKVTAAIYSTWLISQETNRKSQLFPVPKNPHTMQDFKTTEMIEDIKMQLSDV